MADAFHGREAERAVPRWQALRRRAAASEAVEAAFNDHFDEIHRYFHRRVGRDAADDLAAETFHQACRSWSRYDPGRGPVRPWLYGIATKLLGRHYRTEERLLLAQGHDVRDRRVVSTPTAEDDRGDVAAALAALSRSDRDLLLLYAWAELTYDELAQALRLPVGTVKSRLHRIRVRTRELLNAESATTDDRTLRHAQGGNGR